MSTLFTPLTLRSLTIPNRVWMAPMCMYSAADQGPHTGAPTDFHLTHLASRAAGGTGLVMTEATAVRPDGRISPWDLGLWNDQQQQAFTRITQAIRDHGSVPAIQLAHAGRKAATDRPWNGGRALTRDQGAWTPVAPSAHPFEGLHHPHELTTDEITRLVADFTASAERARDAGFQVAEIHGAHGYLLNSFLSPVANHRTDHYGGSLDNRMRLPLEVARAVRAVWPQDLPLFFRTSATDWLTENPDDPRQGWTGNDTVRLAKELQAVGVDLLDVSTGGMVHDAQIPAEPDYQVPLASQARRGSGIATSAVGIIVDPRQAEDIVAGGHADATMLGRQLLREPYWAQRARTELDEQPDWPEQYGYAVTR
ncbi:NADH:flavin oxidoreductase/NADH oxidase [Nocardiopsis kunsanensis]|uniref:Oxidoreductase n=1 Tax=Nocardiopsis kunsanensis TaxID=141693 RepID=A0A919CIH9_9ACTN|nr:NADH:flavin oxidoreductase/NADH oxidase [Nocardiopsis kunsanensis]GHD28856.1 oxidoreductase [Nocardiopsis kunsanensis]